MTTFPLLPAPRIAGLLPAVCPRVVRQVLGVGHSVNWKRVPLPGVLITTGAGTFAALYEDCVGEALTALARGA